MAQAPLLTVPVEFLENRQKTGSTEDDHIAINDVMLRIPPDKIAVYKESLNYEISALRSMYSQHIKSGYGNVVVSMDMTFTGNKDINDQLRRLVAGWRATPFCVCYSLYLQGCLRGIEAMAIPSENDYFFYRPLALALRSATVSTVEGSPDTLTLHAEFLWFNYHPYMKEWVYKTGDLAAPLGTVFYSHLWRKFYEPFMKGDRINWPNDPKADESQIQMFFREYLSNPASNAEANEAAKDLLSIIQHHPKESFKLLGKFLKNKEVRWNDQNIWDIFWRKVGKDALSEGKDVSEEMRKRFKNSKISDGAITSALEYSGAGKFFRIASQTVHNRDMKQSNIFIGADQDTIDSAIKKLTQRNQQISTFEANLPTETVTEGASKYVPLPELSVTHDYKDGSQGATHVTRVFGRKHRISIGPSSDMIVEGMSINFSYNLAVIPMMAYRYPTIQFTGGINISATVAINATNTAAAKLNTAYDMIESMAHRYRMVPQGYQNVWIKNDLFNFFDLKEFLTQRLMTETVPGQPGRSQMMLELSHTPVLSSTQLGQAESFNQEGLQTTSGIYVAIAHRLHDGAITKGDRAKAISIIQEGYQIEPNINKNDPKKKAFGLLVDRYCAIYNDALDEVFDIMFKKQYTLEGVDAELLRKKATAPIKRGSSRPSGAMHGGYIETASQKDHALRGSARSQLKRAEEGQAEVNWRRSLGVSDDFDVMLFSFFMGISERDTGFGIVPNVNALQNAVIDYETAKSFKGQSQLIPGQDVEAHSKASLARGIAHSRRLKTIGVDDDAAAKRAQSLSDNYQVLRKRFNFLDTYKASLKKLTDEIQYRYLDLPEFREISETVKNAELEKGTTAYRDFDPQIKSVVNFLATTYRGVDTDITSYNPDLYIYNRMVDGPNVNVEETGILSPRVRERAEAISATSHKNAEGQVNNWFQKNYFATLSNSKNQRPVEALKRNMDDDAKVREAGVSSYYDHDMNRPTSFNNALSEGQSLEDGAPPLNKKFTVDGSAHAHINDFPIGQAMTPARPLSHMTDFTQMWVGAETGSHSAPTPSTSSAPRVPKSKADVVSKIKAAADEYGIDANDLIRIAQFESGLNSVARNPSGALGLFQIMPDVAAQEKIDPLDPMAAARYTAKQLKESNKSGYDYYLEHNQGKAGARAIRKLAQGGTVGRKLRRTVEANMANQPGMFDVLATEQIRQMPFGTKVQRIARQQALVDEARRRYSTKELSQLFMDKQKAKFEGTSVPSGAQEAVRVAKPTKTVARKNVTSTVTAPLDLAYKEFEKDLYTGQALGLVRAYPSFKLYFIEDDQGERRLGFDDFFNYSSVQSIRIVRDRHIAADLCELYVTNLSGILSNRKFKQERNPEYARDANGRKVTETKDAAKVGTKEENPLASLMLQEGTHFSVYMGYSNNKKNMELVFTGVITELEFVGSEEVVRILGQSYGIELVQDVKGFSKAKTTDNTSLGNFDFWGLNGNAFTGDLLEEMMTQPEVLHFGRWSALRDYKTPDRDLLTNKWQAEPKPQDDNIFPPPPRQELNDFADGLIFKNLRYTIFQTTIWDIFQEMTLRHPNYVASAVPYREIGTDRMTMFFGLPNQLYFAADPRLNEGNAAAAMKRKQREAERKLSSITTQRNHRHHYGPPQYVNPQSGWGIKGLQAQTNREYISLDEATEHYRQLTEAASQGVAKLNADVKAQEQLIASVKNDRLQYAKKHGTIKPFRQYHLLTSAYHIVRNNIQANARDVANTVVVRYNKSLPGRDDIVSGVNNSDFAIANADEEVTVKLDSALPDEEVKTQVAAFLNVSNSNIARRYALALLLRNTKNTYKGELTILGNPKIKPHDVCYLFDEYNDMIGPVEVDRVTHVFTQAQGFITEIKPSMLAQVGEWSLLHSCTAMGIVMEGAMKEVFGMNAGGSSLGYYMAESGINLMAPVTGALFDYFGGFMSEAILNHTQFGFPLVLSPLNHHGRVFAGGVPTHKLPKSMWKSIFGDWSPMAQDGFNMWLEDKVDQILGTLKTVTLQNTEGQFWNNANTLDVE